MDQIVHDLAHALSLMRAALDVIDKTDVAHDVAAHLDLAICRLSEFVEDSTNEVSHTNTQSH